MTQAIVRPALFVPAILLCVSAISSASAARKCGPQPAGTQPIVLVDGVFVPVNADSALKGIQRDEIVSIEIACMDPRDSTFNRSQGIPTMSIVTRTGLEVSAKRTLTALLEVQDAHFRRDARYVESVSGARLRGRPPQLQVTLEAGARGWVARAAIDQYPVTCLVYDGDMPAPHPQLLPRHPACINKGEMRSWYPMRTGSASRTS